MPARLRTHPCAHARLRTCAHMRTHVSHPAFAVFYEDAEGFDVEALHVLIDTVHVTREAKDYSQAGGPSGQMRFDDVYLYKCVND